MAQKTGKTPQEKDPHFARESSNYDNPVHSREYILDWLSNLKSPATHNKMCREFEYEDEYRIEALRRRLIAMTRDGQLICDRKGGYIPVSSIHLIKGRVIGHRDGFGFVKPEDGTDDLFLSARQMKGLFHDDVVLVRVDDIDYKGRRIAAVVEVLERNTKQVVGRFFSEGGIAYVVPESKKSGQDVLIHQDGYGGAFHGQYVVAEITHQPTVRTKPVGKVVEVLGDHLAPGMEVEVAIRSHDIPHFWSPDLLEEIKGLSVNVSEQDKAGRIDLRHLPLVTIDGEDAKDFDDAVYCERKRSGGWRLYVAIADVSHYVRRNTALDTEARRRGTSVYFPGFVVPMLPEVLSNGLCSLNPEVDRLCMVCEMTISQQGVMSGYSFYEAVMHSKARLTYNKVGVMLQEPQSTEGKALREEYQPVLKNLDCLYELYHALTVARKARGAIDFETVETLIEFGEDRKIERIVPVIRNDAHKLIEECMLCANVATAKFINKHNLNGLLRIHEGPGEEKLESLRTFLAELGLELRGGESPSPSDYQALIAHIRGRPDFSVIQTVLLRSLSQAYYGVEKKGHFGLGYAAYTHFTSPIRRYPDLSTHRLIKSIIYSEVETKDVARPHLGEGKSDRTQEYSKREDLAHMVQLGEHCSMTERRADDASRDVSNWLKCEYLQDHVGEVYPGVISAVTSFGVFVELTDLYVEGLVHVSALSGDYYHFDPVHHRLVGERTSKSFCLGDVVSVQVARVDLEERRVDFELASHESGMRRRKRGGGAGGENRSSRSDTVARLKKKLADYSREKESGEGERVGGSKHGKGRHADADEGVRNKKGKKKRVNEAVKGKAKKTKAKSKRKK